MKTDDDEIPEDDAEGGAQAPLVEGVDYYLENGFLVFTSEYLARRGYCCENGCRHCPYRAEL